MERSRCGSVAVGFLKRISTLCTEAEVVIFIGDHVAVGGMNIIVTICSVAGGGMHIGFIRIGSCGSGAARKGHSVACLSVGDIWIYTLVRGHM